jgi:hypothetical protein
MAPNRHSDRAFGATSGDPAAFNAHSRGLAAGGLVQPVFRSTARSSCADPAERPVRRAVKRKTLYIITYRTRSPMAPVTVKECIAREGATTGRVTDSPQRRCGAIHIAAAASFAAVNLEVRETVAMSSLAQALERFNRKERNLLIRAALETKETPLRLTEGFRQQIAQELDITDDIPADAWWATDYHISWLASALAVLAKSEEACVEHRERRLRPFENKVQSIPVTYPKGKKFRQLVEGNQEDVDLVIATGCRLVMVEAKANGPFDPEQLESKLQRVELLRKFHDKLAPAQNPVSFHLLLISPGSTRPNFDIWPKWARKKDGNIPWIPLNLGERLTVERCDNEHHRAADLDFWHVISVRGTGGGVSL